MVNTHVDMCRRCNNAPLINMMPLTSIMFKRDFIKSASLFLCFHNGSPISVIFSPFFKCRFSRGSYGEIPDALTSSVFVNLLSPNNLFCLLHICRVFDLDAIDRDIVIQIITCISRVTSYFKIDIMIFCNVGK